MAAAGLGFFGLVAYAAKLNDKESRIPYVSCFVVLRCLSFQTAEQ